MLSPTHVSITRTLVSYADNSWIALSIACSFSTSQRIAFPNSIVSRSAASHIQATEEYYQSQSTVHCEKYSSTSCFAADQSMSALTKERGTISCRNSSLHKKFENFDRIFHSRVAVSGQKWLWDWRQAIRTSCRQPFPPHSLPFCAPRRKSWWKSWCVLIFVLVRK